MRLSPSTRTAYLLTARVAITTSLDWFDHSGRLTGHLGKPDTYASPRIAPDQASAAVAIIGTTMAERDIWIMDSARGTVSRATFDSGADWFPTWSPDHGRLFLRVNSRSGDVGF